MPSILFKIDGDASGLIEELRKSGAAQEVTEQGFVELGAAGDKAGAEMQQAFAAAAAGADQTAKLIKEVEDRTKRLGEAESLKGFTKDAVLSRQRLEQLRDEVERLGDQATPELRAQVARLGDAFDKAFTEGKQAVAKLDDELGDLRDETRRLESDTFDLRDVFKDTFGDGAQQVLRMAATFGVLVAASKAIGEAADKVKEMQTNLGASEESANLAAGALHDMAAPWNLLLGKSEGYAAWVALATTETAKLYQQTTEQANAQEILTKYTEGHKAALEGVKKETDEIATKEKARADAMADLQKQAAGFSAAGLTSEIGIILDLFDQLGKKAEGAVGEVLRERIEKAGGALDKLGESVTGAVGEKQLAAFTALREQMTPLADDTEKATEAAKKMKDTQAPLASGIRDVEAALKDQAKAMREARSEAVRAEGDLLAQASDIQERIEAATTPDLSGLRDLRAEIQRLRDEEANLATAFDQSEDLWAERGRLLDLIGQKTDELREKERGGTGIDSEALKKAHEDWRGLLDAADAKLQELPESARGAAEAIVARFRDIGDGVGAMDVRDFKIEFAGAMATARLEVGRLEDQAKAMIASIDDTMKRFKDDMVAAAEAVTEALRKGPLAAIADITKAVEALAKAAPSLAEAFA